MSVYGQSDESLITNQPTFGRGEPPKRQVDSDPS